MKKYIIPQTKLGKWSVKFVGLFVLFMIVFYSLIKAGYRGGDTFFSNPPLAISIILAGISGTLAFITGFFSVAKYKERSFLVFVAIAIGLFVIIFISGEIMTPH